MTRLFSILVGFTLLCPTILSAQTSNITGDIEAGKAKAATCAACHGPEGVSNLPENPHLAGQVPGYIAGQLKMFHMGIEGGRVNPVMGGMAVGLSDQDMADLDAYYSSLAPYIGFITPDQEEAALAGRAIYKVGDSEYNIPACMSCHGPSGNGIAPKFPRLSGQQAQYIKSSLLEYKSGARKNDMMNHIAFSLSEEQIEQLSVYISGLN